MNRDEFKELDQILERRAAPETPGGLDERIIAASKQMKKPGSKPFLKGFDLGIFEGLFSLPRPAYALAAVLLIVGALGFYAPLGFDAQAPEDGLILSEMSSMQAQPAPREEVYAELDTIEELTMLELFGEDIL